MGHYPIHFHKAKATNYNLFPTGQGAKAPLGNAFVKDSSIWDSNTRFITLHATHDVVLARNVGYLSMGHGFFLEEGSEINHLFCQNLGVTARPSYEEYFSAQDQDSPESRRIPPILEQTAVNDNAGIHTYADSRGSDTFFPSMFWIMNAYNEFVGNKAAGPEGFGICYWLFGPEVSGARNMAWSSQTPARKTTPTFSTTTGRFL